MEPTIDNRRVLAVSSGGGHWVELLRLMPAFDGARLTFVTVNRSYRSDVVDHRFRLINDATRWNRVALALMAFRILLIVLRERPHVIVTTGAAAGYFALRFGRWIGARTIWVDSIANVEELSMSGQMARECADLWLTQWPHLASAQGPEYAGAVL
ncbi:MAG: UDP-N-acetylglucosamine--LPS N-acetylglucosamine transferase [Planctomycetota bacterium]